MSRGIIDTLYKLSLKQQNSENLLLDLMQRVRAWYST